VPSLTMHMCNTAIISTAVYAIRSVSNNKETPAAPSFSKGHTVIARAA